MSRGLLVVVCSLMIPVASARAGEATSEELTKLRKEVTALRTEVAKLRVENADRARLGRQLVEVARKLAAGEKLADGSAEIKVLRDALAHSGFSDQVMRLATRLSEEQQVSFLSSAVCDISLLSHTRDKLVQSLGAVGGAVAGKVIARAIEQELLFPAKVLGGSVSYRYSHLGTTLALAAAKLKEKAAIDMGIHELRGIAAKVASSLQRAKHAKYQHFHGVYGKTRELVAGMAAWTGHESLAKYAAVKEAKRGYKTGFKFDTQAKVDAFNADIDKLAAWWKANRAKFEFPAEVARPERPADPRPRPAQNTNRTPVEKF